MSLLNRVAENISKGNNCMLSGLDGSSKAYFITEMVKSLGHKLIYFCAEEEDAYNITRLLRGFLAPDKVHLLPVRDYLSLPGMLVPANIERAATIGELVFNPRVSGVVIASAPALMFKLPGNMALGNMRLQFAAGQRLDFKEFLQQLVNMGYTRQSTVEGMGQFSVRGGIIDVFPLNCREPVRIELFGDEIESIRRFSCETQISHDHVNKIDIWPASEEGDTLSVFWDYLPKNYSLWIDEPLHFEESWKRNVRRSQKFLQEIENTRGSTAGISILSWDMARQKLSNHNGIYHSFFPQTVPDVSFGLLEHVIQRENDPFWARPGSFITQVRDWASKKWTVHIAVSDKGQESRIRQELVEQGLESSVNFTRWHVDKGFVSPTLELGLISIAELGGKRTPGKVTHKKKIRLEGQNVFSNGDYVVHENHGIGIFRGITREEVDGTKKEYLLVQFAGTDRLYLPVEKLNMLTRYSGGEREPRLSKLGGSEWERTKKKVKESVQELAGDLIKLYAARERTRGFGFSSDTVWQEEFEEGFEYEETPDQARAIVEVKRDMEKPHPVDRLICGDVGYGKTEVAMRAAFKAVMDHKQVAVLVPTTVLAEQHYQTFQRRFASYPVVLEVLSRFRTAGQQKKIADDLQRGVVDIVIGTHRLLSKDIQFKDLGLLVIDEEHRFGVRQKEKIKTLKAQVDVISLSATPIPRTLHMALTGLRDLSVIDTPPPERFPINTYVMEYNPEIVAGAIQTELEREGQVFFVHNRIQDIERVRKEILELLPDVRIGMAHGRMQETDLANVMNRFQEGQLDILLCTSIIESGLDMPNVNTLIVDQADRMGLAQLYQIRGRVGRTNRVAYAYLTYRPDRVVTETAQKRLNAIREFTEIGSGMKIALRDLEIRGAGNLLGAEQHGHIEAVGFDLYCRLLEEETAHIKGKNIPNRELPQLDLKIDSYIPDEYINDPGIRIQIYRQAMLSDNLNEIQTIESDLRDRFGHLPKPVSNLLRIARLRLMARDKKIRYINTDNQKIELNLGEALGEKAVGLAILKGKYDFDISVTNQNTLVLKGFRELSLEALEDILAAI